MVNLLQGVSQHKDHCTLFISSFSSAQEEIIHNTTGGSTHKICEALFRWFFEIVLFYSTKASFCWNYLFICRLILFCFNFITVLLDMIYNKSNFIEFIPFVFRGFFMALSLCCSYHICHIFGQIQMIYREFKIDVYIWMLMN